MITSRLGIGISLASALALVAAGDGSAQPRLPPKEIAAAPSQKRTVLPPELTSLPLLKGAGTPGQHAPPKPIQKNLKGLPSLPTLGTYLKLKFPRFNFGAVTLLPSAPFSGDYGLYAEGQIYEIYTSKFQTWDMTPASGVWEVGGSTMPASGLRADSVVGLRIANAPAGKLYLVDFDVGVVNDGSTDSNGVSGTNCRWVFEATGPLQTINCVASPPNQFAEQHVTVVLQGQGSYETLLSDAGTQYLFEFYGVTVTPVN